MPECTCFRLGECGTLAAAGLVQPMTFDSRDIRRAMDVYTLDNAYLGTVLRIHSSSGPPTTREAMREAESDTATNGELAGPMPTQDLGNPGPGRQSARTAYATRPDDARPLGSGALVVGRWWGLSGRRTIPLTAVQTVSLERVVLHLRLADLQPSETPRNSRAGRQQTRAHR
jgi:hypothetical protein